jgi:N-acetylmuramoyl-L-alanine amidase
MKVYLSPSTQENNIGSLTYGTEEYRMNQLCDIVEAYLKMDGYTIFRNKSGMTLHEVVADSDNKKPDAHVAIHSNANNKKARGSMVICHRFGCEGEKLARAISEELIPLTPTDDFGVVEGYKFLEGGKPLFETAYTNAPAAIVEVAFHDNPDDAAWIMNNMVPLAKAIVAGINKFFGINKIDYEQKFKGLVNDIRTLIEKYS